MAGANSRVGYALGYMRKNITSGVWPIGHKIPVEADLIREIGVGRSTLREAVRALASMGMLDVTPGRGTFVIANAPSSVVLNEFLNEFPLAEVLSYRRALEVEAAGQAAIHRTDQDLVLLENAIGEEPGCANCPVLGGADDETVGAFESRFHAFVFKAAGNRLLQALYNATNSQLAKPENRGRLAGSSVGTHLAQSHTRVLEAVRAGDPVAAARLMAEHVDEDVILLDEDREPVPALSSPLAGKPSVQSYLRVPPSGKHKDAGAGFVSADEAVVPVGGVSTR